MRPFSPIARRALLAPLLLLIAALACNLTGSGEEQPQPTAPPLPTGTPFLPSPTALPTATPTVAIPSNPTGIPPTLANCTPQTGWPVYTVVGGDTLSQIAQRAGTTAEQLAQANCLSNAELIFVGQKLYVPVLPPTRTPAPSATPAPTLNPNQPAFRQDLRVDPFWLDTAGRAVTYSDGVRIDAGEVVNADRVLFTVNDPAGGPAISIGQDDDPWDGTFVVYDFPAPGSYTFQAIAQNDKAQASSTTFTIRYDPAFIPPGGQRNLLTLTPYTRLDGTRYILKAGETITIQWADAPIGATRVDFTLTAAGGVAQTIGSDTNPADGALITWAVPPGISGQVQAAATMPDASTQSSEAAAVASQ